MNAKEAAAASKKVAAKVKKEKQDADEKERLRKEREARYEREGAVDFLVKEFNEGLLPKAIKANKRSCEVSSCSTVTSDLTKKRLEKDGFKVGPTEHVYHEAYGGSADDGFAYAHDAYSEWIFKVSW